ncbi:hypothetical protein [Streptomyces tauricus]
MNLGPAHLSEREARPLAEAATGRRRLIPAPGDQPSRRAACLS